jgi:hypothetical protein
VSGDATFVRVRAVFAVVDRWTGWLVERFYEDVYRRVGRRPSRDESEKEPPNLPRPSPV